jgi:hypothetical protein
LIVPLLLSSEASGPRPPGEVDETQVAAHRSVTVQGKTINYIATAARMPLKDASGETSSLADRCVVASRISTHVDPPRGTSSA